MAGPGETVGDAWIEMHADDSGLSEEMRRAVRKATTGLNATVPVELDLQTKGIKEKLRAWAKSAHPTVEADIDLQTAGAAARLKAWAARQNVKVTANVDLDTGSAKVRTVLHGTSEGLKEVADEAEHVTEEVGQATEALGGLAGGGISSGLTNLGKGFGFMKAGMLALKAGLILKLVQVIEALGGAAIALAGQLVQASGAILPFAGALGSLVSIAPTVLLGMQGLAKAFQTVGKAQAEQAKTGKVSKETLKAQSEALSKLAKPAREFVKAVVDLQGPWEKFRRSVQGKLFAGLGPELKDTAKTLLPALGRGFRDIATKVNDAAKGLLKWAGSKEGVKTIEGILHGMADVLPGLLKGIGSFAKGLLTLFQAVLPSSKGLGDNIEDLGKRFDNWTKKITKDKSFQKFLTDAKATAKTLLDIVLNVIGGLGNLFKASDPAGTGLLDRIKEVTAAFKDWTGDPANQEALLSFFNTAYTDVVLLARGLKLAADALALLTLTPFSPEWEKTFQVFKDDLAHAGDPVKPIEIPDPTLPDKQKNITRFRDWIHGVVVGATKEGKPIIVKVPLSLVPQVKEETFNQPSGSGPFGLPGTPGSSLPAPEIPITVKPAPQPPEGGWDKFWKGVFGSGSTGGPGGIGGVPIEVQVTPTPVVKPDAVGEFFKSLWEGLTAGTGQGEGSGGRFGGGPNALNLGSMIQPVSQEDCQRMFSCIPDSAQQAASDGADQIQQFADGIPDQFGSVPGDLASMSGEMGDATGSWFDQVGGQASDAASSAVRAFGGLASRMLNNAGSLNNNRWQAQAGSAAERAAQTALGKFKGLGSAITRAIGTVTIPVTIKVNVTGARGAIIDGVNRIVGGSKLDARGAIHAYANGHVPFRVTSGPTLALIGEAGPEAVVPLSRTQALDPAVADLIRTVGRSRGMVGGSDEKPIVQQTVNQTILLPTGDPEAAAMAVANRLALVQTY